MAGIGFWISLYMYPFSMINYESANSEREICVEEA